MLSAANLLRTCSRLKQRSTSFIPLRISNVHKPATIQRTIFTTPSNFPSDLASLLKTTKLTLKSNIYKKTYPVKKSNSLGEQFEKLKEAITEKLQQMEENDPTGWKGFLITSATILIGSTLLYYFLSIPSEEEIDIKRLKRDLLYTRSIDKIVVDGYSQRGYIYLRDKKTSSYYIQLGQDFETFEKQIEAAEVALDLPETEFEYKWKFFDL